ANTTTALAGAMYAVYLGFVSPEITSPARAADPVVVTILGGVGTLYGPIVGSVVYTGMKDLISKAVGNWELVIGSCWSSSCWGARRVSGARCSRVCSRCLPVPGSSDAPEATHDRPAPPRLRHHLRPEHGQHLLPDGDRALALLRPDARDQPRP